MRCTITSTNTSSRQFFHRTIEWNDGFLSKVYCRRRKQKEVTIKSFRTTFMVIAVSIGFLLTLPQYSNANINIGRTHLKRFSRSSSHVPSESSTAFILPLWKGKEDFSFPLLHKYASPLMTGEEKGTTKKIESFETSIHVRPYTSVKGRPSSYPTSPRNVHDARDQIGDDSCTSSISHVTPSIIPPKTKDIDIPLVSNNDIIQNDNTFNKINGDSHSESNNHQHTFKSILYLPIQKLWRREYVATQLQQQQEESTTSKLTNLLLNQTLISNDESTISSEKSSHSSKRIQRRNYAARTIAGLISALAEEATGLEVHVETRNDTPIWRKQIDGIKIQFSRLGFKPLRIGGLEEVLSEVEGEFKPFEKEILADKLVDTAGRSTRGSSRMFKTADEVFDQIDVDHSGSLDSEELARALSIASGLPTIIGGQIVNDRSSVALSRLTSHLVELYDTNGDGVIDRDEYRKLVEDMTEIRNAQRIKKKEENGFRVFRWTRVIQNTLRRLWSRDNYEMNENKVDDTDSSAISAPLQVVNENDQLDSEVLISPSSLVSPKAIDFENAEDIADASLVNTMYNGEGSIHFSGLKLDLRQLLFGAIPLIKRITPGGPLILEPFTMTLTGSFNKNDILESALLDDGLRRLVARALRRRVRTFRDLVDGAVFYGRTWKDLGIKSKQAPVVEVPALTDIEFDGDKLIITGKTRVRTAPSQPFVENSFKLRTKLGTRENGQYIRLLDPEIAVVLECPRSWERSIVATCKTFNLPIPTKPAPIYQFIPLVSPIQKTEQDGFNLGEDNRIKSIYIKDNALRFEVSAVFRPGKFLGNHYLAFTVPNRTFIITMDRIREGIRVARQNKRESQLRKREKELNRKQEAKDRYNRAVAQALSKSTPDNSFDVDLSYKKELDDSLKFIDPDSDTEKKEENQIAVNRPGFIGRFLEGYLEAAREETEKERNERLTSAISEFFGIDEEGLQK